ncbi:MAG: hypothetical protein FJY97_03470 [candidate division Zixibacteria bacterium]|nr:hypothetical protein [candidate division Zixibacteria bacterium]
MRRPVSGFSLLAGLLLLAGLELSCGTKPPVTVDPAYREAKLRRVLVLPVTGVSAKESDAMAREIASGLAERNDYVLVAYHAGLVPEFDRALTLARQIGAALPLRDQLELGKTIGVDAIIVTHRSTITPSGVAYRFESETEAVIRARQSGQSPSPKDTQVSGGYTPISISFPSGLLRCQMIETASGQRLWEAQETIATFAALKKLIGHVPAAGDGR